LKTILILLSLTIIGCFYVHSSQISKLEKQIEELEIKAEHHDQTFKETFNIFRIIVREIEKTSKFIA